MTDQPFHDRFTLPGEFADSGLLASFPTHPGPVPGSRSSRAAEAAGPGTVPG